MWVVSLLDHDVKDQLLGRHSFIVNGHQVFVSDCQNRIFIVKIFDAPDEMPDSVLNGRLSVYGKVFSFRHDRCLAHITNGICTARMWLKSSLPSVIRSLDAYVQLWHPGQPETVVLIAKRLAISLRTAPNQKCVQYVHAGPACVSKVHLGACCSSMFSQRY